MPPKNKANQTAKRILLAKARPGGKRLPAEIGLQIAETALGQEGRDQNRRDLLNKMIGNTSTSLNFGTDIDSPGFNVSRFVPGHAMTRSSGPGGPIETHVVRTRAGQPDVYHDTPYI